MKCVCELTNIAERYVNDELSTTQQSVKQLITFVKGFLQCHMLNSPSVLSVKELILTTSTQACFQGCELLKIRLDEMSCVFDLHWVIICLLTVITVLYYLTGQPF